jgi:hypothetical protein
VSSGSPTLPMNAVIRSSTMVSAKSIDVYRDLEWQCGCCGHVPSMTAAGRHRSTHRQPGPQTASDHQGP